MPTTYARSSADAATYQNDSTAEFDFDTLPDRRRLSTAKWELEIARKNDPTLLCFGTAELDFVSAPAIRAAMEEVARTGHFGYPFKRASYYDAIIGYFERRFAWKIQKSWIASNVAIYTSMRLIIEELSSPGDKIVYQTPVHHIFPEIIQLCGRVPVANPLRKRSGRYEMDFDDLASKTTEKTKLLLLCSPHNPVGRVWSRDELERLHDFCASRNIIVATDEVYCGLIFEGNSFTPFASVSKQASLNSVTMVSASKSFNLTGLKHSLVIAENPEIMAAYMRGLARSNLTFGGSTFGEVATEVSFRDCDRWSAALMRYIEGNYEYLLSFFSEHIPAATVTRPEATYFAWLDFSHLGFSLAELRAFFEDDAHVVVTLGEYLGPGGEGHVRFNLGTSRALIVQGLERIRIAYARRIAPQDIL